MLVYYVGDYIHPRAHVQLLRKTRHINHWLAPPGQTKCPRARCFSVAYSDILVPMTCKRTITLQSILSIVRSECTCLPIGIIFHMWCKLHISWLPLVCVADDVVGTVIARLVLAHYTIRWLVFHTICWRTFQACSLQLLQVRCLVKVCYHS